MPLSVVVNGVEQHQTWTGDDATRRRAGDDGALNRFLYEGEIAKYDNKYLIFIIIFICTAIAMKNEINYVKNICSI